METTLYYYDVKARKKKVKGIFLIRFELVVFYLS